MHARNVKVGGRYNLKIFGSVRPVDVVGHQSYGKGEKPRNIWSVVEVNTGKYYSVFSARSFLEKIGEVSLKSPYSPGDPLASTCAAGAQPEAPSTPETTPEVQETEPYAPAAAEALSNN